MKSSILEQITASPLVWFAGALLGGIVLSSLWSLPFSSWVGAALVALAAALMLRRLRPNLRLMVLLVPVFFCLGAARYQSTQTPLSKTSIAQYNDQEQKVYVTGVLAEEPDVRDTSTHLRLTVTQVDAGDGDIPAQGALLVVLDSPYPASYGDTIRVHGFIRTPRQSEDFSYRDYLARQGVLSILTTSDLTILPGKHAGRFQTLIIQARNSLVKGVYNLFPDPEASLIAGILLGSDNGIPQDVVKAFQDTGTSHIIAISGFNIAIVAAVLVLLFGRLFGKNWGGLLAILGILFYTILVGASPSVVRAAIMGTLSVFAVMLGRRNLALTSLAAAAAVMALVDPRVLWDVGFQLSFAATLGLVFYAGPLGDFASAQLQRILPPAQVKKYIAPFSDYFLLTFAAQITTLPISFYYFGKFSLVAFITNPLVLPAQPALMILSGLAVSLSHIYQPLGKVVAWLAWPFAAYTIRMVELFARIPYGAVALGEFSLLAALAFYLILIGLTFTWPRFKGALGPGVVFTALTILTVLTWRSLFNLPDGRLHVLFLDVGSADGILVTTPSGKHILINGGASPSGLADQLGRRLPPFTRSLDSLVVASTQENQLAALPRTLLQYRPQSVIWAGNAQASFSALQLKTWLTDSHIPVAKARINDAYDLGSGATMRILAASTRGAVVSIEMGAFKAVLPVGVNDDSFAQLDNGVGLGPVSALLLSESGYAPSNPPDWLANLHPDMTILSVSAGDPNGLPDPALAASYENGNLLRTDRYGWIDLATDGQQTWVTGQYK